MSRQKIPKPLRELSRKLKKLGVPNDVVINKRGHARIYFDTPKGRRFYATGISASDCRRDVKAIKDILRMAKGQEPT